MRLQSWTNNANKNPLSEIGIVDKKVKVTIRRKNTGEATAITVISGIPLMKNVTRLAIDLEIWLPLVASHTQFDESFECDMRILNH